MWNNELGIDEVVLRIRDVSIRLPQGADREHAVHNFSMNLIDGEVLCIVGESGSGKSVLALAAMGLLPSALKHECGDILYKESNILQLSNSQMRDLRGRKISMIFQEPMTALNPVMKVGDQIDEVLRIHTSLSKDARRSRTMDIIEEVRLPNPIELYEAYPHQLSGGQRQRIMIAAALILNPQILIADEPTTALDVTTQSQILKLIKDLQRKHGTSVIFITHDFGVVAEIADRVAVMHMGELIELDTADRVLRHPQANYTRHLISSVPDMTLKPAKKTAKRGVILTVRNLSKMYRSKGLFGKERKVEALKDVSVDVRRGTTVGVVGESGSGKSTLARCIVKLIEPSGGSILVNGRDMYNTGSNERIRELRRSVQIVFQDPNRSLNPRRTVGQSIVEGPMNFGSTRKAAWLKAERLIERVGLKPESLQRYPHEFSGGQRQRICIARALVLDPVLLVADEAVSALDMSVQAKVLELLAELSAELSLSMLFVTHDLRVAAKICDEVIVMRRGEVVEVGDTSTVFASPRHEYTKILLDAAPGKGWAFGQSQPLSAP